MTSILTNSSALAALQTLKSTNKSLDAAQGEITTGLKISTAKDNASTWAIAQTMRSDVSSFKQISDGLATSIAAVNVGVSAAEKVSELLQSMKDKVTASMTPGADTAKIQTDINNLREQISTVVSGAQFNGLNFVSSAAGASVLTSLDRTTGGGVTASTLSVSGVDLSAGTAGTARAAFASDSFTVANDGDLLAFSADAGAATVDTVTIDATNLQAGDKFQISVGGRTASYTVTDTDMAATTPADVIAVKLKAAVENLDVAGFSLDYDSANPGQLIVNNDGTGAEDRNVSFAVTPAGSGGLSALNSINVSSAAGRTAALATIETAMTTAIDAAAALGSSQARLEIQQEFIGELTDSVTSGIGALVDADMEEASARLQALQVQQQLGIQALSIANQAPQSILSLFR